LAVHVDGDEILRVQVKGRLAIDKKYYGKDVHIAFPLGSDCYVFPHDEFVDETVKRGSLDEDSRVWAEQGKRSWPRPPSWALDILARYKI